MGAREPWLISYNPYKRVLPKFEILIDNEEYVARCKERKNIMKEAVVARNAFVAGHFGYSMALKNAGAALSHSTSTTSCCSHSAVNIASSPPPPPMEDNLPPPMC